MSKFATAVSLALLTAAYSAGASAAGDAAEGQKKANAVCIACHATGAAGSADWTKPLQPEYPVLAGQHADYLVTALNEYKLGSKTVIGRKNAIMAGQAGALSKKEIEDLAAFFSGLPGPLHVKR